MNRALPLLTALSLLVAAHTPGASAQTASTAADPPPMNIVMIAVDDLNDWVGFLGGHPQSQTPHMDRLAAQGVVFENANCATPTCNPSRSALMSGIAPWVSNLHSNNQEMRESPVLKDAVMLPRYLSDHGYTSMVRGKIFHHADMDPQSWDIMSDQGKDKLKIPKDRLTDMSPYKDLKVRGSAFSARDGKDFMDLEPGSRRPKRALLWEASQQPKELTQDYQNALWAAQWLTDSAEQATPRPFFLACGIFRPHLPWVVPAEYYARFDPDTIQLPPIKDDDLTDTRESEASDEYRYAVKHGLRKDIVRAYLASSAYADDCVGVILDALENSPYRDNTIVVLWGDHGWHLGEKLRYHKLSLYEEAVRVPFIVKVPGLPAARTARVVNLLDLYPTLVELAGVPEKEGLSGRSLVPLLKDPDLEWDHPTVTYTGWGGGNFSVRDERWRYSVFGKGFEELYDIEGDPQEWTNLAGDPQHADVRNRLKAHVPED